MISFAILAITLVALTWILNASHRQMEGFDEQLEILRSDVAKIKLRLDATESIANDLQRTEMLRNH